MYSLLYSRAGLYSTKGVKNIMYSYRILCIPRAFLTTVRIHCILMYSACIPKYSLRAKRIHRINVYS